MYREWPTENFGLASASTGNNSKLFQSNQLHAPICSEIRGSAEAVTARPHMWSYCPIEWMDGADAISLSTKQIRCPATPHLIANASQGFNGGASGIHNSLTSAWVVDLPVGLASQSIPEWLNKFSIGKQLVRAIQIANLRWRPKDFM